MTITFDSYRDKFRLENALIFAEHDEAKIAQIREIEPRRAEQMEDENAEWSAMRMRLHDIRDISQPIAL